MLYLQKAEEAATDIVRAFENPKTLPKPLAQIFIYRHDNAPCRSWSWRNQLIVALRGHSEARGFRQWESAGRRVRKGEQAFRILAPLGKKVVDVETGEERVAVFGFRGTPVFGIDQTDGDPVPSVDGETEKWLSSLPLRDVASQWGLSVEAFNAAGGECLGAYQANSGIALSVRNLSAWSHLLVKAADDRNEKLKGSKANREIVAELGGAVLLRLLGSEEEADLGGCWQYVKRHAGHDKAKALRACGDLLDRTCQAVALILDTAEEIGDTAQEGALQKL